MKKLLLVSLCFLMLCVTQVFAQSRTITGTVTAKDDGQPVPGASVKIKGTSIGTQTNSAGKYTLRVSTGQTLIFTFVGYDPTELPVGNATVLNAQLGTNSKQLTEVVVTSFGIQRQAASLGFATSQVTGKDINTAKPVSVINGLTGKVSGLQINTINSGLFAPSRVTLRGNRSLTGNNQPLIVVDGAIYYSDISTLNPEDIQSTDILKGSSAAAVYGSDASNGVIVITTKHGTKTPQLTISSTLDVENVDYLPAFQTRFGSNGGEKLVNDFNDLSYYIPYENQSYGPEYNGKLVPLGRPFQDGSVVMTPYSAIKNQKKDFFQTGITTHQNFSYSSGDDNGSFYMSAQDVNSKAVMPGDVGRRDVFRIGGDKKYGIFSLTYGATYTYLTKNTTNTSSVYDDLLETPLLVPLKLYSNVNNKYGNPDGYYNDYYVSPYQVIAEDRNLDVENHINANVAASLKPLKWLNLTYRSAIDNNSQQTQYKDAGITYSPYTNSATADTIYYSNSNGTGIVKAEDSGTKASAASNQLPIYGITNFSNLLWNSDFLLSVSTNVYKKIKFSGTAGVTYLENKITNTPINNTALNFTPYNTQNYAATPSLVNQYQLEARKLGYFGEGTFSWDDWAFVHGSYRTDLDTRLSKANRYIPYYDIDGSVVLSEAFKSITDNDYLNFAKIRYAHSLTGNISALSGGSQYIAYGAYQTLPTYTAASGFPYASSGISGYSISSIIANPNIKPEKVTEDEVGLELGFLKDRINFSGSYYKSKTADGIVYAQVSRASGFTSALVNAANTSNDGLELDLTGTAIKTTNFSWTIHANYTHTKSKVESIVSGVNQLNLGTSTISTSNNNTNSFAVVGLPYPQILGYDWTRDPSNGKVIVDPNTGLPTRASSLSVLGNANPTDIVGLSTSVRYKNFTLSVTADYRGGYKIFNSIGNTIDHSGVGLTTAATGRQRFVMPNSEYLVNGHYVANTNVEVQDANYNFWPTLYNSVDANYVISADAWKIREAALAYSVPTQWIRRTKFIKGATLTVSGRNLLMLRPGTNKFTDPEFSDDTGNAVGRTSLSETPPTRIISTTLAVTF